MENDDTTNDLEDPEFTLEEAREWLTKVEDDAWVAGSRSAALEFIFCNLLVVLNTAKVIDGIAFTQRLQHMLPLLENSPQISAGMILDHLQEVFANGTSGGSPGGYVLH